MNPVHLSEMRGLTADSGRLAPSVSKAILSLWLFKLIVLPGFLDDCCPPVRFF